LTNVQVYFYFTYTLTQILRYSDLSSKHARDLKTVLVCKQHARPT